MLKRYHALSAGQTQHTISNVFSLDIFGLFDLKPPGRTPRPVPPAGGLCNNTGMQRSTIVYAGQVQGVGFRFTARRIALDLGLTGWVRNNDDGSVTVHAEGGEDQIKALRERIRASGVGRIDRETVIENESASGLHTFEIVR